MTLVVCIGFLLLQRGRPYMSVAVVALSPLIHPNGVFAALAGTYVDQEVELDGAPTENEQFWTVDAAIGYRLSKRLGSVMLQGKNLFDTEFRYQDSDFRTTEPADPRWIPKRSVFLTLSIVL